MEIPCCRHALARSCNDLFELRQLCLPHEIKINGSKLQRLYGEATSLKISNC